MLAAGFGTGCNPRQDIVHAAFAGTADAFSFARESSIPSLQTVLADILFSSSVDCGSTRNHTTGPSNFKRATSALGGLAPQELSVSQDMVGSECNTSMQVSQRSKGSCDVLKIPSNRRRSYFHQGTCLSNAVMEGIIPGSKFFIVLSWCDRITSCSWNGRDIRKVEHAGGVVGVVSLGLDYAMALAMLSL